MAEILPLSCVSCSPPPHMLIIIPTTTTTTTPLLIPKIPPPPSSCRSKDSIGLHHLPQRFILLSGDDTGELQLWIFLQGWTVLWYPNRALADVVTQSGEVHHTSGCLIILVIDLAYLLIDDPRPNHNYHHHNINVIITFHHHHPHHCLHHRLALQVTNLLTYLESLPGAPCPPGRYCPAGTSDPLVCPNGTFRGAPYGASLKDCGPCQAGFMCINGDPAPEKCPKGEYCQVGKLPQPCPMYTYNPFFQQVRHNL